MLSAVSKHAHGFFHEFKPRCHSPIHCQMGRHTAANILAVANSVTDAYWAPARFPVTNGDGALTNDVTPRGAIFSKPIRVTLSGSDALTNAVRATIFMRSGS